MTLETKRGFTVWFTGLSGAGKSTLAQLLKHTLDARSCHAVVIDGAEIRKTINVDLGFSEDDRSLNVRRMGDVCDLLTRNGVVAIAAAVSPSRKIRGENRRKIGRYVEVYCKCPLKVLVERDNTNFYKDALAGKIKRVAGIDVEYEEPRDAEVVVETDKVSPQAAVKKILKVLKKKNMIPKASSSVYTPEEEDMIKKHLKGLGYI